MLKKEAVPKILPSKIRILVFELRDSECLLNYRRGRIKNEKYSKE